MREANIITTVKKLRETIKGFRFDNNSIGFVPTMGALHEGHLSLIKTARDECKVVVVSIFVNPLQFGPAEDYHRYPRTLEKDAELAFSSGADLVFAPSVEEMYPQPQLAYVEVEKMTDRLCGAKRPGHFRGVTTVVSKLFNIVQPDKAYFGQKDAQQAAVIKRMVTDLAFPIEIVVCPTSRENDGLARSSRNSYLNEAERKAAPIIFHSLQLGADLINKGEKRAAVVREKIKALLDTQPLVRLDYIEIVDFNSLEPVSLIQNKSLIAIAVYIGNTRLIDNVIINVN